MSVESISVVQPPLGKAIAEQHGLIIRERTEVPFVRSIKYSDRSVHICRGYLATIGTPEDV